MNRTEADVEREQIEYVFGLTGGELETEPWAVVGPYTRSDERDEPHAWAVRYWYDGAPEYVSRELGRFNSLRTVVANPAGYSNGPDAWLADESGVWMLVDSFTSSGETECPGQHEDAGPKVTADHVADTDRCYLCEGKLGDDHGYIYIGDGYEAVYARAVHDCDDCNADVHCQNVERFVAGECDCSETCRSCAAEAFTDGVTEVI